MPESPSPDNYITPRLKDRAVGERPQERLVELGASALSDSELIAVILRTGRPGMDVLSMASQLMARAGSVGQLLTWKEADFRRITGIGRVKALQLISVLELARRALKHSAITAPQLHRAEGVFEFLRSTTAALDVEKFWVLCLNRKNRLLRQVETSSGTATASLVHPREVFRAAIREGSTAIICAHNHPSGDPSPSAADIQVTRLLRDAAKTVDIEILDHVIMGDPAHDPAQKGYFSFRAAGML